MAKSKRIIVTICAVLITFVISTVSANAFQTIEDPPATTYFKSTIPFEFFALNYNTATEWSYDMVDTYVNVSLPMSQFDSVDGIDHMESYISAPLGNDGPIDTMIFPYHVISNENDVIDNTQIITTEWDLSQLDTSLWGTMDSLGNRVLNVDLRANEFWISKSELSESVFEITLLNDTSAQTEVHLIGTLYFIITNDANNKVIIEELSMTSINQYDGTYTFDAMFSLENVRTAINTSSRSSEMKQKMLDCDNIFVQSLTLRFQVPKSSAFEFYPVVINQQFKRADHFTNYDSPMESVINNLPTFSNNADGNAFNVLPVIMTNLDNALSTPIIGELTIGWIVWICVAIGALFGILKYFAGG